ncbi:hypothetical protein [Algivirga pacifica]|uniref:Phage protein D n=1 Tax=Algivirga pacifica TaxID=1162670 RepID=A0ABP9D1Y7_9BACT
MSNVYTLSSRIVIGKLEIRSDLNTGINKVVIRKSVEKNTDTATLYIPRALMLKDRLIEQYIKEGDKVQVWLGYDGRLQKEFEGYVKSVATGYPLKIECEDEMYKLKTAVADRSFEKATLKDLLNHVAPAYSKQYFVDENTSLGSIALKNATGVQALDKLRDYGLLTYFRDGKLCVGFRYSASFKTYVYDMRYNVRKHSLKLKKARDTKILVKAISNSRTGKKVIATAGDKDGAVRTLNFLDKSKVELQKIAEQELANWKFDGVEGTVTGFGYPLVQAGDQVALIPSSSYQEFEGTFTVQEVETEFSTSGFSRKCKLGFKV